MPRAQTFLKVGGAAGLLAWAAWVGLGALRSHENSNPDTAKLWFYDVATKKLYAAAADTIPPDRNVDCVHAVVISFEGTADAKNRKIAYLETCTPELKDLLEKIKAARAAHRVFEGNIPSHGSGYYQSNMLVRRVEESKWHSESEPEGQEIMAEWHAWHGPNGERAVACVP